MAQIIDEIYPPWLVTACLSVVGLGLAWVLYKLIKVGMVVVVTALLLAIVAFVGWMILVR